MSEPLLSARGLSKSYTIGRRTLEVLRSVDLDVARGEFLALRGASGAGKSTLLHLIGGLDSPNAGEIRFDGQNLAAFSEGQLTHFRNRRVGFVFQAYHLLPELTALENVCLPARVARVPAAQAASRGCELLARAGLGERTEHKPFELSGANSSASPSRARSSTNRRCCSRMNRPAIWIRAPAAKLLNFSRACVSKST